MTDSPDEPGLDSRLEELDSIVNRLDREDLELQEALDLFEEGVAHVREAFSLLERTRLKVEKLVTDMDGEVALETQPDEG
jgi:exodeoxyribonuclease VII small subunit